MVSTSFQHDYGTKMTAKSVQWFKELIESDLRDGTYPCNCVMKVHLDSEVYVASYKQRSFGPHACGGIKSKRRYVGM